MHKLRSTQANALIITMFLVTVLASFISVAYNLTSHNALVSHRSTEMNSAYAVADGAIELLYCRWRYAMKSTSKNLNVNDLTSGNNPYGSNIADIDLPTLLGNANAAVAPFTINAIKLTHVDIYGRPQADNAVIDPSKDVTTANDPVYFSASPVGAGFTGFNIIYEAKVWVTCNLHGTVGADGKPKGSPVTVGVKRYFTKGVSPTMQAAIFYENQLELHPGSNMLISGLVHTNDNLYACGRAGESTLSFGDEVSYVGYYNQDAQGARMMTDADRGIAITDENTQLSKPAFINGATLQQTGHMSVGGVDPDDLHPDNSGTSFNYNDDSYREVIERPVRLASQASNDHPETTKYGDYYDSDPSSIATQRLYNQASLKILLNAPEPNGPLNVTIRRATPDKMADGSLVDPVNGSLMDKKLYKDIVAAINPGSANNGAVAGPRIAVPDLREADNGAGDVKVSVIDMAKLKAAIASDVVATSSSDPNYFNGVLYISDVTGSDAATGSYNNEIDAFNNANDAETNGGARVKHGIMLVNAAELPQNTATLDTPATDHYFTLATDDAVYVKGDYNTGGYGASVPTNVDPNSSDTWNKSNVGYTPVMAAIMGDAVAVVSSHFDPTKATAGINDYYQDDVPPTDPAYVPPGTKFQTTNPAAPFYVPVGDKYAGQPVAGTYLRQAVPTTVNTAVVSGYTPTLGKSSSGGAQNLIRLLENWGDPGDDPFNPTPLNFTYQGSLMQSFLSKEFDGTWSVGNNYSIPNRQVRFNPAFLTTPPKATPSTIVFVRGTWERFNEPVPAS